MLDKNKRLDSLAERLRACTGRAVWNYSVDDATCCICGRSGRLGGSNLNTLAFTNRTGADLDAWNEDQASDEIENIGSDCLKQLRKIFQF